MQSDEEAALRPRRGIYLLPNLLTTGCLFSGFYAIVAAIDGNFERAGVAVFIAMVFDGLDGRVARLTSTESAFGKEYDSLADMVAFGLAPAIVSYQWGVARIAEYGRAWYRFGWVAAFFFAAAAALRLARFNTRAAADKRYFEGLPSPSAAAIVAAFIWFAGALMVSRFSYPSFKGFDLTRPVRFIWLIVVVLIFVVVAPHPQSVLLAVFAGYALSAPLVWVWRRIRRAQRQVPPPKAES
jgi:CDP-diacylglycerol--serine O-phosphatidyltransferase